MIFVDSNVPMYLVGAAHPHKADAQRLLERCVADDERLVTDAEVLQEILHRYTAIGRRDAIGPAFEALLAVVDEVFPIELRDVERSRDVLLATHDVVQPDLLFVAREHADRVEHANVKGAPDLLVEVLSPTTRRVDERTKRDRYRATGVAEYWIVDPELETIKVHRWAGRDSAIEPQLFELERGATLTSPLLPGLELPLAAVFE